MDHFSKYFFHKKRKNTLPSFKNLQAKLKYFEPELKLHHFLHAESLSSALACIADALNLLSCIELYKWLEKCVGRLQRRLSQRELA